MPSYQITPESQAHTFRVVLKFIAKSTQHSLKLPAWIPGSYMIREFSKNIIELTASQNMQIIKSEQVNKNTWTLNDLTLGEEVTVCYSVYAYDFGIRSAYLDHLRGYFNNTSLCLYLVGYENIPHKVILEDLPSKWQIATSLTKTGTNEFIANSYAELIDAPFELGEFTTLDFIACGTPHHLVLSGKIIANIDSKRLLDDISKICAYQINLFGGVAPFTKYTFLLHLGGEVYTGLEHANATALMAPYYSVPQHNTPNTSPDEINDEYVKLLALISHEYFHVWNVKRIKPQVFNPYDLETENYTKLLWWFEGVTSYYDDLVLYRCGLINKKRYLQIMLDNINNVYKYSGVGHQSLANSSLTSWIKYYRQDENSPNSIVSYYVKGSLVAMCLDLLIRRQSTNSKSLDSVIQGIFQKWQLDGLGIEEDELPNLILKYSGRDLATEINQFVNSCAMLPLDNLLAAFGIKLHSVLNQPYLTKGKIILGESELNNEEVPKIDLGCKVVKDIFGYRIINIYANSLAYNSDLAANDIIIAIDGVKLVDWDKQFRICQAMDSLRLTVFRRELLLNFNLDLQKSSGAIVYNLQIVDEQQSAGWLDV